MNINNARLQSEFSTELSQGLTRQQLERAWQSDHRQSWTQKLQNWGAKAVAALTQGQEPKISSVMTDEGLQWQVYDPMSNQTHHFTTETEVRAWLEQRYYLS